jgi:hypothetical protein
MKSDTLFFAALFLTGTGLWTRIAIQGFELGLLSAVIEWSMNEPCKRKGTFSPQPAQPWSATGILIDRT